MSPTFTVVISCAGMGRRLGLAKTKALAQVCGKPLIHWQLAAIDHVEDVRIVVGYQSEEVISCVRQVREDVVFAYNRDYETTGTAASFVAGARGAKGLIVSLDGDLLVTPREFRRFTEMKEPVLGVLKPISEDPLYALMNEDQTAVSGFSRHADSGRHCVEWSGLCQILDSQIAQSVAQGKGQGHVYELLEPHLPLPALDIEAREIDTPDDFALAETWLVRNMAEWKR